MSTRVHPTIVAALLLALLATEAAGQRGALIEARELAYTANYQNDKAGLRAAIASLEPLAKDPDDGAYANYYLWWSYWVLTASHIQDSNMVAALETAKRAHEHARLGVAVRDQDPEFHAAVANALIAVGFLDRPRVKELWPELATARRRALELGPNNPRAVMMDATIIYWSPPERGGGPQPGLARWLQAMDLLRVEANAETMIDPIVPRWGYGLSFGWTANMYLTATPPQKEKARAFADTAIRMRPDYWYVREVVLPKLRE